MLVIGGNDMDRAICRCGFEVVFVVGLVLVTVFCFLIL
jgi:hypothetical protein